MILANIFTQFAIIKPTGPNVDVNKYDIKRNNTENNTIK